MHGNERESEERAALDALVLEKVYERALLKELTLVASKRVLQVEWKRGVRGFRFALIRVDSRPVFLRLRADYAAANVDAGTAASATTAG